MSLILDGSNGLSDVDGTAATPAIRGTDTNTGIFFPAADTIAFSEGGTEAMRLDGSGNLGIGTSSPATRLHIALDGTTGPKFRVQNTNATSNNAEVQFVGPSGTVGGMYSDAVGNGGADINIAASLSTGTIRFATGSGAPERMRIDSGGRVLVNRTSAFSDGNIGNPLFQASNIVGNSAAAVFTTTTTATQGLVGFVNGNGTVGQIQTSGSGTSYNTSSDYRLKENIEPMTGALDKVVALKPVTYTWKVDGSAGQGFIAHELAEVVPDCVSGEKDAVETVDDVDADGKVIGTKEVPRYQGIDTSFLVATLTCAIQELKTELDNVKAELATLKA
jgi:hypothetical protein